MKKALDIAINSLRRCYEKNGMVAGRLHYKSIWARDSFYASWGALEIGDHDIVKKNLELFFKHLKKDGQVPIRYGASKMNQWLELIGFKPKKQVPSYSQDKGFNPAIDPNLLFLITLERYVQKTKDYGFAKENQQKIHFCLDWLEMREKLGLIKGGKYSTWQDIVKKKGFCLYTNVLYYQAVKSVSCILKKLNIENELTEKSEIVKKRINEEFWNEKLGYYIDCYDKKKRTKVFSSDGNLFAILFDVADRKKALSILKKADELGISNDVPSITNIPKYGISQVYWPLYLVGMQDYNNNSCWTWLGCLHSMALSKAGKKKEAKRVHNKLSRLIIRDKNVFEIYEKDGTPMKRLFYRSEHPFAWSAGFYVLAHKML